VFHLGPYTRQLRIPRAEETQSSDTVAGRHHDDVPSVRYLLAAVQIVVQEVWAHGSSHHESTAIEPEHHGQVVGDYMGG